MSGTGDFAAIAASCFDQRWHFDPVEASAQGLSEHDGRLGEFTEDRVQLQLAGLRASANALEEVEVSSIDDEIDRTALLNDLRVQSHVWIHEQPHVRDPGFWVNHLLEGLYHVLAARDRDPGARRDAVQARLEGAPALLAAAEATLAGCPRPFIETANAMLAGGRLLIEEADVLGGEESFVLAQRQAKAALDRFAAHLHGDLMDQAAEDFAIGVDGFNYRLAFQHALRATTPEILRFGVALVDEVTAELEQMAAAMRPGTPWQELMDQLRADQPAADRLVPAYADSMARARAFIADRGLVSLEDAPLEVIATPEFLVPVIPFAAYQPPGAFAEDGVGRFYVTQSPTGQAHVDHCQHEIPITALHEGWPGHHLQFARAVRHDRLVRRLVTTPVTVEGWALYCEDLLAAEGFLSTDEERFFQRVALLLRAVRVVLDVGLHTQDVSRTQAVDLLMDRVHMERRHAEAEVRRYTATPAYQLAYAVGRRELKQLRADREQRLGDQFDLRMFHDAVLGYGGLPVSLIRWGLEIDG